MGLTYGTTKIHKKIAFVIFLFRTVTMITVVYYIIAITRVFAVHFGVLSKNQWVLGPYTHENHDTV